MAQPYQPSHSVTQQRKWPDAFFAGTISSKFQGTVKLSPKIIQKRINHLGSGEENLCRFICYKGNEKLWDCDYFIPFVGWHCPTRSIVRRETLQKSCRIEIFLQFWSFISRFCTMECFDNKQTTILWALLLHNPQSPILGCISTVFFCSSFDGLECNIARFMIYGIVWDASKLLFVWMISLRYLMKYLLNQNVNKVLQFQFDGRKLNDIWKT